MRKFLTFSLIAFFLTSFLFSCKKQARDRTFKLRVSINPPLQIGVNGLGGIDYNFFNLILSRVDEVDRQLNFVWIGGNRTTELATWESKDYLISNSEIKYISDPDPRTVQVSIILENHYDYQCRQVTIEGWADNKLIKTVTFEMGYSSLGVDCKHSYSNETSFYVPE